MIICSRSVRCRAMHRSTTALAAAVILALTGCGGDPEPEAATAEVTPSATPSPTPATTTAAPPSTAITVGKSATFLDGQVTTTVLTYRQPAGRSGIPKPDQPGYEWASIEIKVCTKILITVSTAAWMLTYTDGAVIEPSGVSYEELPQPRYPWADHQVKADRCVRGWISYEVPKGERPAYVQYQPSSGESTEWKVG